MIYDQASTKHDSPRSIDLAGFAHRGQGQSDE
jgi:hypothetical protein